ncbi:STAS domain-containing protein [Peribacillus acanthi]|uniref:STAS domain-containing protein n=1 Tax=Peribacillus acanthi TaxID=2171554 RepID=UPI000D3E5860|nr:STAS domain-containing protein [Peribacillus acanthi]
MYPIERFSKYLLQNSESISKEIVDYNLGKLEIELPVEIIEKSINTNREFLEFLGNSLNLTNEEVAGRFIEWHKQHAAQTETQFSFEDISKIVRPYAETRLRLIEMLTKVSIKEGLSTEEVVYVNNRISFLLDLSITESIIERERLANEANKKSQNVIRELSSPVVPIQNGVAILPLIGEFDLDRSEHILTSVIPKINDLNIETLIIDFSGIATIDTEVAREIFKIKEVLDLIGVNSMLTGIRPELAINIIKAGIDFTSLNTYGTVQQAILSTNQ